MAVDVRQLRRDKHQGVAVILVSPTLVCELLAGRLALYQRYKVGRW